jgi:hypothetical protein
VTAVKRESEVRAASVTALPGAKAPPAAAQPVPATPLPEPKRSKAERLEGGRGYWQGIAHGAMIFLPMGLIVGLFAAAIAFGISGPILADFAAKLDATRAAREAVLGR